MKTKLLPAADWYKRIAVSILNGEITDKAFNMNDWNKAILCSRRSDSLSPLNICKYNEERKAAEQSQCLCRIYLDLNQNCLCSFDNFFSWKEWSYSSITVHSYWLSCLTLTTWSFKCSDEHYPDFNLNKAKNYIKRLTTKTPLVTEENITQVSSPTILDDTFFNKYFQGTYTPPTGVTITYTHNGLTHDGDLIIHFTITNNLDQSTITVTKTIVITGLTSTHTTGAIDFITSLTPKTNFQSPSDIAPVALDTIFNKTTFEKYFQGTYNPPTGVVITFTHDGLTHDGDLVIHFTINLGDASRQMTKTIHVSGINQGKAKTYFDSLIPKSSITLTVLEVETSPFMH